MALFNLSFFIGPSISYSFKLASEFKRGRIILKDTLTAEVEWKNKKLYYDEINNHLNRVTSQSEGMGDVIDTQMSRRYYPNDIEKETVNVYRFSPETNVNTNSEDITCLNIKELTKPRQKTWPPTFKLRDLFFAVLGLVLFVLDLISDWRLAVLYFLHNQNVEFYLTLGFILGPSLFSGVISIVWYTTDHVVITEEQAEQQHSLRPGAGEKPHSSNDVIKATKIGLGLHSPRIQIANENENGDVDENTNPGSIKHDNEKDEETNKKQPDSEGNDTIDCGDHGNDNKTREIINKKKFCLRIIMSCLQLGRIFRLFIFCPISPVYTCCTQMKDLRSIEYIIYILKSWRCHSSRQEHIRLKAIEQKQDAAILVLTMLLSLGSTALTHTVYYRTNRKSKRWKENVNFKASIVYFLWRLCELSPRFLLLALSVYCLLPWIFVAIVLHIFIMFICFSIQNPKLSGVCPNRVFKTFFLLILSYVALFCNVNLGEGKNRFWILLYYILFYAENIVMATVIILIYHHQLEQVNYKWAYSSLVFIPSTCATHIVPNIVLQKMSPKSSSVKII
ncbi:hypothetical protein KUTeg_018892 [Tegillarca granosa]|uniref:XK-related protein n=1 Tax=Tegillarca granosa TaxID=220873 RepID=A0ABQ9EAX7_TEGGR|nr:hypothetical protein KUTeg_018892 [Tegillarca granosa]